MPTHTILGGKVYVFRRDTSRIWQCSTYLAGCNRPVSTKEENFSKANEFAEDWDLDIRGKRRRGDIKSDKTFKDPVKQFIHEYEVITVGQRHPRYASGRDVRLRKRLIPFFDHKGLSDAFWIRECTAS